MAQVCKFIFLFGFGFGDVGDSDGEFPRWGLDGGDAAVKVVGRGGWERDRMDGFGLERAWSGSDRF